MAKAARRTGVTRWLTAALLCGGAYACGSVSESGGPGTAGAPCSTDTECAGGTCENGTCTGSGNPGGSPCSSDVECASGRCSNGICGDTGSGGATGSAGASGSGGTSGSGTGGASGSGNSGTTGPHFPGTGKGWRPLTPGCGPETADQCTGTCERAGGSTGTQIVRPPATLCFSGAGDPTPQDPSVVIEQVIERHNGKEYVHIRITFDPAFTDNTYGAGSCCGWPPVRGHWFFDLLGSDHTELLLTDAAGNTVMNFKIDFISADPASACANGTLGVRGGDGSMLQGNPDHVLAVATSLDRNLNGCGYCKNAACAPSGDCTVDSPPTDDNYTPNPATPDWDYRQVYEVWIDIAAFGGAGFGQAYITYTHSSPAKGNETIQVDSTPCPPQWDKPYCPPSVTQEGGNCFGGGSDGGAGCPPNEQIYVTSEGAQICTPIPFAGYPNRAPCPDGYVLDIPSEGQYCVPAS